MIAVDMIGIELGVGDRVWLVTATSEGFARVCAGTVIEVLGDAWIHWLSDGMSAEEWAELCHGCDVENHGVSHPTNLKVVGRAVAC